MKYSEINEFIVSLSKNVAHPEEINATYKVIKATDLESLASLGINFTGNSDTLFFVAETKKSYAINVYVACEGCIIVLGEAIIGRVSMNIKMHGAFSMFIAPDLTGGICQLNMVSMRSAGQKVYFGRKSTAVGASIEIEGKDCHVAIGDDCMLSSGIWIRNHDMHAIFDIQTSELLNKPPSPIVLESHVWIGQDSLILGGVRICGGSIVGAKSLVKKNVAPQSVVAGVPARIIRTGVGWSRNTYTIDSSAKAFYNKLLTN